MKRRFSMLNKFSIFSQTNSSKPAHRATSGGGGQNHFLNVGKRVGFTLAEVLITLGIIGVVAAMTIPGLMSKYQEIVTVNKLKKIYSTLSQAMRLSVLEYGTPDGWGITERDAGNNVSESEYKAKNAILVRDKLFYNVKKIQNCDDAKNQDACGVADTYKYLDGTIDEGLGSRKGQGGSLAAAMASISGTTIMVAANAGRFSPRGSGELQDTYAIITVDLNGPKPPNVYGKDLFPFYLTNQNIMPVGTRGETAWPFRRCLTKGYGCTAWVIENKNMEYLKCKNLSWDGKKTCK